MNDIRDALDEFYAMQADAPKSRGPCSLSYVKPQESLALCVRPKQIAKAREWAKRHGVPTEFNAKGEPILTSRSHRKAYHKIRGVFDRDGGYGDSTDISSERRAFMQAESMDIFGG